MATKRLRKDRACWWALIVLVSMLVLAPTYRVSLFQKPKPTPIVDPPIISLKAEANLQLASDQ